MGQEAITHSQKVMEERLRVKIDCSKPVLTDQSFKKSQDINNIMKQYSKTGILPSTREHLARYVDNTQVLSIEEAHEVIKNANEMFMQLPADIRKLMDNDPSKMVEYIKNPNNKEILVKHGVLIDNGMYEKDSLGSTSPKPENSASAE